MKNAVWLSVWSALVASSCSIPVRRASDEVCASQENFVRIPLEHSCVKYIQCYSGSAYPMQCPDNTWFNEAEQICDKSSPPEGCELNPAPPMTESDSEEDPGPDGQPESPVQSDELDSEENLADEIEEEPESDVNDNPSADADNDESATMDPNSGDLTQEEEGSGDPGIEDNYEEASGGDEGAYEDGTDNNSEPIIEGSGDDYDVENPNVEARVFEELLGDNIVYIQPIDVEVPINISIEELKQNALNEDNLEDDELMDVTKEDVEEAENIIDDEAVEEPSIEADFEKEIPKENTGDIPMYA